MQLLHEKLLHATMLLEKLLHATLFRATFACNKVASCMVGLKCSWRVKSEVMMKDS